MKLQWKAFIGGMLLLGLSLMFIQGVKAQDVGTLHPERPIPPITAEIAGVYFFTCTKSAVTQEGVKYSVDYTWGTYVDFKNWRDFHISYASKGFAYVKGLPFNQTENLGAEQQAYNTTIIKSLQESLPEIYAEVIKLHPPYGIVYACPTEEDRDYIRQIEVGLRKNNG